MDEREQLEQAIAHLESQRPLLGDSAVDAALAGLRQKLAALDEKEVPPPREPVAPPLEGERKLVTVMFADISGFTALSEKMDAESVRDMVNACFETLAPIVAKYQGTVDKFIGDEVMALFGAPIAHERAPEHALRAALEMMEALERFNARRKLNLGLHFGINTGPVVAGGIGSGKHREYSVMGDAVNLASRLEDASERGEILVGPDTYRLTAAVFTFETRQPIRVKGKSEPVQIYRLLGIKTQTRQVCALLGDAVSSPLVGRDSEVRTLFACVERVVAGQGGIVFLFGEAGMGKSRLLDEVLSVTVCRDDNPRVQWLLGRTLSFGQMTSYWPFQEVLWHWAGITETDSDLEAWDKLEGRVSELFGTAKADILPYLASLLSLEVRGEYAQKVKYLDGQAMRRQVFLASRRFFERLCQQQPLVLVFEDLHWMDESSALLLEHLFPVVEREPLLICGSSRPDPETPAIKLSQVAVKDHAEQYTEVRLTALSSRESSVMVRNLLESETLPPHTRDIIVRKAEGNPFFLEEIIRSLIDAGGVARDPVTGRWRATPKAEVVTIPDTIQGVILARVDRLEDDVKKVLRTAAVIGRSFFYQVLRAVEEAQGRLDEHLAELQTLDLISEKQKRPELEFMFRHALAQEATYESILLQKRRDIHARVGKVIEALYGDRLEEFYTLLAYHYARAEAWEKAQDYLLKAGDQAGRVAADGEALTHYKRAVAAYANVFGDKWEPLQRTALERKIGEALFRRGEHAQALEYLLRALGYLGKGIPTSRRRVILSTLGQIFRQAVHRTLPGVSLLFKSPSAPPSPEIEELFRLYEVIGWIDAFWNNERLLYLAVTSLNVSERAGYGYGMATGSMAVGTISDLLRFFRLAGYYHRRSIQIAESIAHPRAIGMAYLGGSLHDVCRARWEGAIDHALVAAKVFKETGELRGWGYVIYMVAVSMAKLGRFDLALAHCREMAQLGQDGADVQVFAWGLATQGLVERLTGRLDEAVVTLERAAQAADSIQDHYVCIWAWGELGRSLFRQGKPEAGLKAIATAEQYFNDHPEAALIWIDVFAAIAEGHLMAYEQLRSEAETRDAAITQEPALRELLDKAADACRRALKQGKGFPGVMPEAMRLYGTYKWLNGQPSAARKWWRRSLTLAETLRQRYDQGMALLEVGRRLDEAAQVERAATIFTEIGAKA